ncbi:WD repeat-containing protein 75 [Stachybotrys elegans]|uniref:WD repeat-containing protein 75 n=1 Tax=Stachybotrys elegans TaxID=80388 RepID=A0A8K0SV23_9HYPO|nr:WD repeat-containing protein 75 [Stachybotrys elegans]
MAGAKSTRTVVEKGKRRLGEAQEEREAQKLKRHRVAKVERRKAEDEQSDSEDEASGDENLPEWTLSKPLGGRMLDVDPILTQDEKYLIIPYNTSIQVYLVEDSLLLRRIPIFAHEPTAPNEKLPCHAISIRQSIADPDFVWVACLDGRIFHINWTHQSSSLECFQTASKTAQAMAVGRASSAQASDDIVLVLESDGTSYTEVVAYSQPTTPSPQSKSLLKIQKAASVLPTLEIRDNGRILAGSIGNCVFVGLMSQQKSTGTDNVSYEFSSFDTPSAVSSLDIRLRSKKASNAGKGAPREGIVDVVAGGSNGGIFVYHNVLSNVPTAVSTQEYHWHRRPVRSVKWSKDGEHVVSGGSEKTLSIWHTSTGNKRYLPHLPGAVDNIVVSPKGSSYVVHMDDNSVMMISTTDFIPSSYISGLQSATSAPLPLRDNDLFRQHGRLSKDQEVRSGQDLRHSIPAVIDPRDPGKLHVCASIGNTVQRNGQPATALLQSFNFHSFSSKSQQALANLRSQHADMSDNKAQGDDPCVSHMSVSSDGKWLASVDEWMPSAEDAKRMAALNVRDFQIMRREVHLKFWELGDGLEPLTLVSEISAPHHSKPPKETKTRPEPILDLVSNPASAGFATIGRDGIVRIWKPRTRKRDGIVVKMENGNDMVTWACAFEIPIGNKPHGYQLVQGSLAISEDGSALFAAFGAPNNGLVYVINTFTGAVTYTFTDVWKGQLRAIGSLDRFLIVLADDLSVINVPADDYTYGIDLPITDSLSGLVQLAVDQKSGHFAVAIPTGDTCTIGIFDPYHLEPINECKIPHRVVSLVTTPQVSGFLVLDDSAQVWAITSGSFMKSIYVAAPLEDIGMGGRAVAELNDNNEATTFDTEGDSDGDEDLSADEADVDMGDAEDGDEAMDDIALAKSVPQHLLTEIFDAGLPIEETFNRVLNLVSDPPLRKDE